jgi:hypothetical protein
MDQVAHSWIEAQGHVAAQPAQDFRRVLHFLGDMKPVTAAAQEDRRAASEPV